jgi:hypothetical protein
MFLRAKGNTFQELFEKLMGLAYKGDFMACRPWGRKGDQKNDGFLKSEQRLFQVYAPNEMKETEARRKIHEDFKGAKEHWGEHFDKWVFVHNAYYGLPPHIQQIILDFKRENPKITLETWGFEELLVIFRKLSLIDLESWLGEAPTNITCSILGFKDLEVVLETISSKSFPANQPVRDVPKGKIEANALSESITVLLKTGMTKATLVEDFFNKWHDPTFGERIATAFKAKYEALRIQNSPTQIFLELQEWAGGTQINTPEHQLAVLSVLAYYFERCDIFEEPSMDRQ